MHGWWMCFNPGIFDLSGMYAGRQEVQLANERRGCNEETRQRLVDRLGAVMERGSEIAIQGNRTDRTSWQVRERVASSSILLYFSHSRRACRWSKIKSDEPEPLTFSWLGFDLDPLYTRWPESPMVLLFLFASLPTHVYNILAEISKNLIIRDLPITLSLKGNHFKFYLLTFSNSLINQLLVWVASILNKKCNFLSIRTIFFLLICIINFPI